MSGPRIEDLSSAELDQLIEHIHAQRQTGHALAAGDASLTPLSSAQRRMWFLHKLSPEGSAYNLCLALLLDGQLHVDGLRRSVRQLFARHPILRTCYPADEGLPVPRVLPVPDPALREVALGAGPESDAQRRFVAFAEREAARVFDLEQEPAMRAFLARLGDTEHGLAFVVHHIAFDSGSVGPLMDELSRLYAFELGQSAVPPPAPTVDYAAFAAHQRARHTDGQLDEAVAHWRGRFAHDPGPFDLGFTESRSPDDVAGSYGQALLSHGEAERLERFARGQGCTLFALLLSTLITVLYRWTGRRVLTVGIPTSSRERFEFREVIGLMINTVLCQVNVDPRMRFAELLTRTKEALVAGLRWRDVPFERLVERLRPAREGTRIPLFQVMLNLKRRSAGEVKLGALRITPVQLRPPRAPVELLVEAVAGDGPLEIVAESEPTRFPSAALRALTAAMELVLEEVLDDPDRVLEDFDLVGSKPACAQLAGETAPLDRAGPLRLEELFLERAKRRPGALAVVAGEQRWTYQRLATEVKTLAGALHGLGVRRGAVVALLASRTPQAIAGALAILQNGAVYVPMDPDFPRRRLVEMAEDALVRFWLGDEQLRQLAPRDVRWLSLDAERVARAVGPKRLCRPERGNDPAYVIFTSGSSGRPKGIWVTHRSAMNLLAWSVRELGDSLSADVLATTSFSFDPSLLEIFGTLSAGGTIVLLDNVLELPHLCLEGLNPRFLQTVSSAMDQLLRLDCLPQSLRTILLTGERLTPALADRVMAKFPAARLYDCYGPSEVTVYATCARRRRRGPETIGRPILNTRVYLVDAHGRPVPRGVPGEIRIGGPGVALGYVGRPGMTSEHFLPDPSAADAGARLYKSGDRGVLLEDDRLCFLGRLDRQVKVRGYRVELSEVEHVLQEQPGVGEALVQVDTRRSPADGLIAGIVPDGGPTPSPGELRRRLAERLPVYMVPHSFCILERAPRTPSGKIARSALDLSAVAEKHDPVDDRPPTTPLEHRLVALWSQVLDRAISGVGDNFFELGGHSLLAARVVARVGEELRRPVLLRTLFENPTPAAFAAALTQRSDDAESPNDRGAIPARPPAYIDNILKELDADE